MKVVGDAIGQGTPVCEGIMPNFLEKVLNKIEKINYATTWYCDNVLWKTAVEHCSGEVNLMILLLAIRLFEGNQL